MVVTFIHRKARHQKATWVAFFLMSLVAVISASPLEYAENTFDTATPAPADASVSELPVSSSPTSTQDQENAQMHSEALLALSSSQTHTSDAYSRSSSPASISSSFVGSIPPTPNERDSMPWVPGPAKTRLRSRAGRIGSVPEIVTPPTLNPLVAKLPSSTNGKGGGRVVSGVRVEGGGKASAGGRGKKLKQAIVGAPCILQCRNSAANLVNCINNWNYPCLCNLDILGKQAFRKFANLCIRLTCPPAEKAKAFANHLESTACDLQPDSSYA